MIPAGYMFKRTIERPDWIKAPGVRDIYALSGCISLNAPEFMECWDMNGWWLYDTPDAATAALAEASDPESRSADNLTLCYFEVFEDQYSELDRAWSPSHREDSFPTNVRPPETKTLLGYDVATFWAGSSPEHSPLSCNGLAEEMTVNEHCLFDTLDAALDALKTGKFDNSEPGPFKIFAIYHVP